MERSRLQIALCVLVSVAIGLYQVYCEPPLYDATAEILLRPIEATDLTLVYGGSAHKPVVSLPTEAQILDSETILGRVARELKLADNPRFSPLAQRGVHVDPDQPEVRAAMIAGLRTGLSIRYDEDVSVPVFGLPEADASTQKAKTRKPSSGPRIMYLSFTGPDPETATAILKAEIKVYEEHNFELRRDAIRRVSALLIPSLNAFKNKVESEQRELIEFQQRDGTLGGVSGADTSAAAALELVRQEEDAKARLRLATARKDTLVGRDSQATRGLNPSFSREVFSLQHAVEVANEQLADLESTFGPNHPSVLEIEAKIGQLRRALAEEEARSQRQIAADFDSAKAESAAISHEVRHEMTHLAARQNASIAATALQIQLNRDSELYYVLVNNVRTADIDGGYGSLGVDILNPPEVPARPRRKDYLGGTLWYVLGGLAAGILVAGLIGYVTKGGMYATEWAEQALRVPVFGEVPWSAQAFSTLTSSQLILSGLQSPFSRAVFGLRHTLLLSPTSRSTKMFAFTGAASGQECSTIAIHTAIALATLPARVLLIDADPHRPILHRRLCMESRSNLTAVLRGQVSLENAVAAFPAAPGLNVLTAGPTLQPSAPMPMKANQIKAALRKADALYDYIVVDTGSAVDAGGENPFLALADLALLVVRDKRIGRRKMVRAGIAMQDSGVRLAGFVRIVGDERDFF